MPPNSVVSGSERTVCLETQASMAVVEVALLVTGAKAEAMLRADRTRAAEVFMVAGFDFVLV